METKVGFIASSQVNFFTRVQRRKSQYGICQRIPLLSCLIEGGLEISPNVIGKTSRRGLLTIGGFSLLAVLNIDTVFAQSTGPRTVFDEERELYLEQEKKIKESQLQLVRAGFDAVEKASAQLNDIQTFLDNSEWASIQTFTRLYNDSVERELMEKVAKKLPKETKEQGIKLCKDVTRSLMEIDRLARTQDITGVLKYTEQTRQVMTEFLKLRP